MSMQMLTILQFIAVLAAYLGMTVLLPAFVFYRKVSGERFCVRFMIYLVIGNVYLMNMVMVLQLLHISNRFTLALGTVLPVLWAVARVHNVTIKDGILGAARAVNSFLTGTMGGRLLFSKILRFTGKCMKTGVSRLFRSIRKNFFDWVLTVGFIVAILWLYGCNLVWNMGYCTSDIPVHNYWINGMDRNEMFIAGVYPHGFHSMIYYLHKMFGFYTFVLLRVFCLVQNIIIHMVLLAFLKACCRMKYSPYVAMVLYVLANIWHENTYTRYFSSLPQEFGMIFILPSIYFLTAFFEDRRREDGAKGWKLHSSRYLLFFALSFSATLAAHFYNTMAAGLFCVGVAIGYAGILFRKEYFGRVMAAGILSVVLAVLPMVIAVATGTPLEGSLRWGMSIIKGTTDSGQTTQTVQDSDQGSSADVSQSSSDGAAVTIMNGDTQISSDGTSLPPEAPPPKPQIPLGVRLKTWISQKWNSVLFVLSTIRSVVHIYVLDKVSLETVKIMLFGTVLPGILGLVCLLEKKNRLYGCTLLSVFFCQVFLYVMIIAWELGIPALMDKNRCSIYLSYILAVSLAFAADAIVSLFIERITRRPFANIISLSGVAIMIFVLTLGKMYKTPVNFEALECNDAITCLTNILRDNPRFQFTVCSANDELRMVEGYGYHYETITFLQQMEGERQEGYLTIPTQKVYFFIEKVPVDYTVKYEGSGRKVSEVGAYRPLPYGGGLSVYKGANRYTVMSKMYYWALAFKKLYPNEMRVYYETDTFICYEVEQNTYRLFDFSIDYGYNSYDMTSE